MAWNDGSPKFPAGFWPSQFFPSGYLSTGIGDVELVLDVVSIAVAPQSLNIISDDFIHPALKSVRINVFPPIQPMVETAVTTTVRDVGCEPQPPVVTRDVNLVLDVVDIQLEWVSLDNLIEPNFQDVYPAVKNINAQRRPLSALIETSILCDSKTISVDTVIPIIEPGFIAVETHIGVEILKPVVEGLSQLWELQKKTETQWEEV